MAKSNSNNIELPNTLDNNEGGVLAMLWGKIIVNNHITGRLGFLLENYKNETTRLEQRSVSVKRKTVSSLTQNICAKSMTWSIFLDLLFNYLKVRKVSITIKLTWNDNSETFDTAEVINPLYSKVYLEKEEEKNVVPKI